jgi:hypothetical protein
MGIRGNDSGREKGRKGKRCGKGSMGGGHYIPSNSRPFI